MNLSEKLRKVLARLRQDQRGSILVELALTLPIMVTMLAGVVEAGYYLVLNLKIQHSVISIADLATRDEEITQSTMDDIFLALPQIMTPYYDASRSRVYVSAVSQVEDEDQPSVFWQRATGNLANVDSAIGIEGEASDLPTNLRVATNETVLVTEFYFSYRPLIFDVFDAQIIRRVGYFRPRIGALQSIEDDS